MSRLRAALSVALALAVLAVMLVACGGGDDEPGTTTPPASASPGPSSGGPGALPPGGPPDALPPAFVRCMKEQGFDVQSIDGIHSAPPEAFQACLGSLHGGGAAP